MSPARAIAGLAVLAALLPSSSAAAAARDMPLHGEGVSGTATLTATATSATLTAPAVRIDPVGTAVIHTCVQVHVPLSVPRTTCDGRTFAAPAATLATPVTRTFATGPGWVTGFVEVFHRAGSDPWRLIATSWAPGAIATQSLPLTGADEPGTSIPQGVPLDGTPDGGADTGARDSVCSGLESTASGATPAGVTADALGGDAPAYSETGAPAGALRGLVLLLHGGGWTAHGSGAATQQRPDAERWRARGWLSVSASYRPCGASVDDALWFVDRIRERYGHELPMCVSGVSAGGHLALLVAARRPGLVDCVAAIAAPADLGSLAAQTATDPSTGEPWATGPAYAHNLAVAAFGSENLVTFSPAAARIRARVLAAVPQDDALVPAAQVTGLATAQAALGAPTPVEALVLAPGAVRFGHGSVSAAEAARFHEREDALRHAAEDERRPPATDPPPALVAEAATQTAAPRPGPGRSAAGLRPTADPAATARPAATLGAPGRVRLRRIVRGGTLRLRLSSVSPARARVRIVIGGRIVTRASVALRAGRARDIRVRLPRAARKRLRASPGPRRITVRATIRPAGGGAALALERVVRITGAP